MLKGSVYSPLTLRAAIKKYDRRNPKYIDEIVEITKLDLDLRPEYGVEPFKLLT